MASEHETAEDYEDALEKQREAERRDDPEQPARPPEAPTQIDPDAPNARAPILTERPEES